MWKMIPIYLLWCIWMERITCKKKCLERIGQSFEVHERQWTRLELFFSQTLFQWSIVIDFNGMDIHDFLVSLHNHAQVVLLYMYCMLGFTILLIKKLMVTILFYNSSRGLQQGELLFPPFFAVVMEALSKMLCATVGRDCFIAFSVGRRNMNGLQVSHLLFAY